MAKAIECKKCERAFVPLVGEHATLCKECAPDKRGPIETQVYADLSKYGRDLTTDGAMALRLAREMDSGEATSSALATVSKQLRACIDAALEGVVRERQPTAIDRIRAARAERNSSHQDTA